MIEYIKFLDHSKATDGEMSHEEALSQDPHVGEFCGELLKEDDESVTIALLKWSNRGDVKMEFVYVILKKVILERYEVKRCGN